MEVMSGSLGQGISQAAGIAMGRKLKGEPGRVWVFMSDGEFQPGQTWEAIQTMVYYRLDNIGIYVDVNGQQCDGTVEQVMTMEPLDKKLRYFGARVYRVNGHDIEAIVKPAYLKPNGKPLIVLADTNPCQGMDILQKRAPKLHYIRFEQEADRLQLKSWYETQMSGEVI
jgi:transketolase